MTVEGTDSRASPLQLKVSNWNRSVFLRSSSPLVPVRRSTSWQELWRIRQSHLSGSQRSVTRAQSPHYTLKCISMTRSQNSGQNTQMLKQLCATPWVQEGNLPSDRSLTIKERSPLHDSTHWRNNERTPRTGSEEPPAMTRNTAVWEYVTGSSKYWAWELPLTN